MRPPIVKRPPGGAKCGRPPAPRPPVASCRLSALADERLVGALPGLLMDDGWPQVDTRAFSCCGGSGSRLMPDAEVTVRCDVGARLRHVRTLYRRLRERGMDPLATGSGIPPSDAALPPRLELPANALGRLRALQAGESSRGLAFVQRAGEEKLVSIGALALASAWRFGLVPHVVLLGRGGPVTDLFPPEAAAGSGRSVIFVAGASALWDAVQADALDALVGFAYRSLTPLFLDLTLVEPPARANRRAGGGLSTRQGFSAKIAGVKSRSPLSWLTTDCVAKLPSVVDGLDALMPRPSARPTRAARPALEP